MDLTPPSGSAPPLLAPGTLLGPWRIVALAGRGVHGEVYRAVRAHEPDEAPPVALKLALRAWDSRFSREAKLLSLTQHPSVPKLVDQGTWRPEGGGTHPFLVMEWVDGEPLYEWAQRQAPTREQVLRLLLELAEALEALHAQGGIHRDVKGANILMRRADGRAMLMDFGSGVPPGASTLTPPGAVICTPAYRSAESWLFEMISLRDPGARYTARPADDVFALGATACCLLTGHHPEPGEPAQDKSGTWSMEALELPPTLQEVEEPLRALVLSMLTVRPEQRPSATQLVQALEQASGIKKVTPVVKAPVPERVRARVSWANVGTAVALTTVILTMATWTLWTLSQDPALKQAAATNQAVQENGRTSGMAESVASVSKKELAAPSPQPSVAEEPLPEPQPGQLRTNSKGQCPRPNQFPLNGACWGRSLWERDLCEETHGQMYKGLCYLPITPPGHPPTSGPKPGEGGTQ